MRVITFSTKFPVTHPRKGEPTFFVEKILNGFGVKTQTSVVDNGDIKSHTIRAGNRWKVGDYFSPRIWSGKPYASKQVEFLLPIQIKKIWNFQILKDGYFINGKPCGYELLKEVAKNDGLEIDDFEMWFASYPETKNNNLAAQILCWNDQIEYP